MKRIIITMLALLAFASLSNGQGLRRVVLGVTLGETTVKQSVEIMNKKGYKSTTPVFKNVPYEGVTWDTVCFVGTNDIGVRMIGFEKKGGRAYYKKLCEAMKNKYSKYIDEDKTDQCSFYDGKILLGIELKGNDLYMTYTTLAVW